MIVPEPLIVRVHAPVSEPAKMPATVCEAFMVTVNAGVPVPTRAAKAAALPSVQLVGVVCPLKDVLQSLLSQVPDMELV